MFFIDIVILMRYYQLKTNETFHIDDAPRLGIHFLEKVKRYTRVGMKSAHSAGRREL